MTDKIFSMPVRVNDLIANTVNLKNDEFGVYLRLLCFAWEEKCKLCNEIEEIYEICKAHDEKSRKVVDKILKKYFTLNSDNCFNQKAQVEEWNRIHHNSEIRSFAGKIGGQAKNKQNSGKEVPLIPILRPILRPNVNNKIIYSEEFDEFWTNDGRSIKSDTFIQYKKLSKEDKKDLKRKWELYKDQNTNEKGKFFKACERFIAKRIFDQISLQENVVQFDPLTKVKSYVSFVKKGQRIPSISDDMVKIMLKEDWITKEEFDRW